jgi:hypothetical protein
VTSSPTIGLVTRFRLTLTPRALSLEIETNEIRADEGDQEDIRIQIVVKGEARQVVKRTDETKNQNNREHYKDPQT